MIEPVLRDEAFDIDLETVAPRPKRIARVRRRNYGGLARIVAIFLIIGLPVMTYLWFMAQLTATNYAIMRASGDRAVLLDRVGRLDEKLARLESPERLGAIAQRLGMHEPSSYAVVTIADTPPDADAAPAAHRIAFLGALAGWLRIP